MSLDGTGILRLAYVGNILILVPVCWALFLGSGVHGVFGGKVEASPGLGLLIASLWFAILACSAIGLAAPELMAPIIVLQLIYKSLWLATFALPLILAGRGDAVPWGVTGSFIAIILIYPILLWRSRVLVS